MKTNNIGFPLFMQEVEAAGFPPVRITLDYGGFYVFALFGADYEISASLTSKDQLTELIEKYPVHL